MKKVLSIAGSDCSGGAGIQADLKTFAAHGVYGMSVVTSVVAENTARVISYQDISPTIINEQMTAVFEDIYPDAVKIGMLSCADTMLAVADGLKEWQPKHVVLDPVMYAKNGNALMEPKAIDTLIAEVLPLATLITPNIPEAEKIVNRSISSVKEMERAAKAIHEISQSAVLIKGGHRSGEATDVLFDGENLYSYSSARIPTKNTHGTGCTFSSAIASQLALGATLEQAVSKAKKYITMAIEHSLELGKGHGPTNHFYSLYHNGLKEEQNE
ncbi:MULTISPECIES: bifunctional hydroxymethylpyrimidine kinase/phosphomethylpyrimidine kinase [unclassified Enterococcus]|uniref:bifunctional hydroxymethylpyrimidine kinase/phosphomethylpyrimidine kinase n=1 Tax=unclassified Enterococcus TaxID=2608891 RepID=UPI001A9B2A31|nr:bifunctional hydroxymethylpyrimidine kinase/phosphomethylpyrimidine kinase [Enterococcus sp. DIV1271a]MBO1299344.1 bifunctional hydroxymethylpyrimidine kinase/phosphomethylpyrimidine kinase [Enterococcus sp. DIV1271a]